MNKLVIGFAALLLLSGCKDGDQTAIVKKTPENSPSHMGQFCMPCFGPHINLNNGKIDYNGIGMGPGIELF